MADYEGCWFQGVHPESRHLQKLFHSTMGAYSDPCPSSTLGHPHAAPEGLQILYRKLHRMGGSLRAIQDSQNLVFNANLD